jgi:hypothetical protein
MLKTQRKILVLNQDNNKEKSLVLNEIHSGGTDSLSNQNQKMMLLVIAIRIHTEGWKRQIVTLLRKMTVNKNMPANLS